MSFLAKNKGKILAGLIAVSALIFAFFMTGNAPQKENFAEENAEIIAESTQTEENAEIIAENMQTEENAENIGIIH